MTREPLPPPFPIGARLRCLEGYDVYVPCMLIRLSPISSTRSAGCQPDKHGTFHAYPVSFQ
jgi:hypothetical protein